MKDTLLRQTQRNEIYGAIRETGLNPADFKLTDYDRAKLVGLYRAIITHERTGYHCTIEYHNGEYMMSCSPILDSVGDSYTSSSWEEQIRIVYEWLTYLKQELEAPDLWAAVSQETKLIEVASTDGASNIPFSNIEQKSIVSKLNEIEKYLIQTQNLDSEQAEFVSKRLNYLEGAVNRLGRQDWLQTTIGILVTLIIGIGLAPDEARELFRFVTGSLQGLFSGLLSLP